jgi:hypothetical protein
MSDGQSASGNERDTVCVSEAPKRILGNLLIDGPDGQCAFMYAGIGERCPNEAVAHTYLNGDVVEMCPEHTEEDVPEPPTTEQEELVTDGGQPVDDVEKPNWDEDRVTLSFVRNIIDAHPDYTVTSHIAEDGHRYTMIQFFEEEPNHQANTDFVEFVSEIEDHCVDTDIDH